MNKELIKKYKNEFDHWLNGGELLVKANGDVWSEMYSDNAWAFASNDIIYNDIEFRIKPEESKFKVGDWVRAPSGCIYQINETNIIHGTEHFTMWQPEPSEWCWFWNEHSFTPTLGQLTKYNKDEKLYFSFNGIVDYAYVYCEPFIGQLPTHLKE